MQRRTRTAVIAQHGFEFCAGDECKTAAIVGRFACTKYSANGISTDVACTRNSNAWEGKEVCYVISTNRKVCSAARCSTVAAARGFCSKHGAREFCFTAGFKSPVQVLVDSA